MSLLITVWTASHGEHWYSVMQDLVLLLQEDELLLLEDEQRQRGLILPPGPWRTRGAWGPRLASASSMMGRAEAQRAREAKIPKFILHVLLLRQGLAW